MKRKGYSISMIMPEDIYDKIKAYNILPSDFVKHSANTLYEALLHKGKNKVLMLQTDEGDMELSIIPINENKIQ